MAGELDAAVREMFSAGPNRWVPTANAPTDGVFVQRGLTGDYASGQGGLREAQGVLDGTWRGGQTVSVVQPGADVEDLTRRVTSLYNDPLSVQARVPSDVIEAGRSGDAEGFVRRGILPTEVSAVGAHIPDGSDLGARERWARNYLELQDRVGATPDPGSRGAQFTEDLRAAYARAQYVEDDSQWPPQRRMTNPAEVERAVDEVLRRYQDDGPTNAGARCRTCRAAPTPTAAPAAPPDAASSFDRAQRFPGSTSADGFVYGVSDDGIHNYRFTRDGVFQGTVGNNAVPNDAAMGVTDQLGRMANPDGPGARFVVAPDGQRYTVTRDGVAVVEGDRLRVLSSEERAGLPRAVQSRIMARVAPGLGAPDGVNSPLTVARQRFLASIVDAADLHGQAYQAGVGGSAPPEPRPGTRR